MFMTPKKILGLFASVPIYSTSGVVALAGLIFLVPGGIFVLTALCLCWLADRLTSGSPDDHIDTTTIEEYERNMSDEEKSFYANEDEREPCEIWKSFYGEDDDG
jgi:hypothetical protein